MACRSTSSARLRTSFNCAGVALSGARIESSGTSGFRSLEAVRILVIICRSCAAEIATYRSLPSSHLLDQQRTFDFGSQHIQRSVQIGFEKLLKRLVGGETVSEIHSARPILAEGRSFSGAPLPDTPVPRTRSSSERRADVGFHRLGKSAVVLAGIREDGEHFRSRSRSVSTLH